MSDELARTIRAMTEGLRNVQKRVFNLEIQETYSNHVHEWSDMQPGGECGCGTSKWPGGQIHFCTDCLKPGETTGNGTGLPVYCDKASGTWKNVYNNAAATH